MMDDDFRPRRSVENGSWLPFLGTMGGVLLAFPAAQRLHAGSWDVIPVQFYVLHIAGDFREFALSGAGVTLLGAIFTFGAAGWLMGQRLAGG